MNYSRTKASTELLEQRQQDKKQRAQIKHGTRRQTTRQSFTELEACLLGWGTEGPAAVLLHIGEDRGGNQGPAVLLQSGEKVRRRSSAQGRRHHRSKSHEQGHGVGTGARAEAAQGEGRRRSSARQWH